MIRLADIWYRYPSAEWALKEIALETPQGQYLVICGGNGSGKSTLGYLLNGLAPHFFGGVLQGSVYIDNASIDKQTPGDLLATVGLVFQNADAQLFNATVEDEIAFELESLGLPRIRSSEGFRTYPEPWTSKTCCTALPWSFPAEKNVWLPWRRCCA